jgi:hypothetical protein
VVEGDHFGDGAATERAVATSGPPDHDVRREHPRIGHADRAAQHRLAAVVRRVATIDALRINAGGKVVKENLRALAASERARERRRRDGVQPIE